MPVLNPATSGPLASRYTDQWRRPISNRDPILRPSIPPADISLRKEVFAPGASLKLVSGQVAMSGRPSRRSSRSENLPTVPPNDKDPFNYTNELESGEAVTPREPIVLGAYRPWNNPRAAGEQPMNAKVAIPRLDLPLVGNTGRVSQACHNCRKQKNKCSGHRPSCLRCQETNVLCVYVDGKRERNARQLTVITSQLQHYESLVRELYPKLFDTELGKVIDQALEKIASLSLSSPTLAKVPDESDSSARTLPYVDHTLEDFNRDISLQAIGFTGEHSASAWLYRLRCLIGPTSSNPDGQFEESTPLSISSCAFFIDDTRISPIKKLDALAYPSKAVADELVDRYFQVAHASFPVVGKEIFLSQCRSFYSKSTAHPGNKWMALLNMVFAIAARHFELSGDQSQDHNIHAVYFTRAWQLHTSESIRLENPNLQQAQVEGLISLYLLSIGQANRSWRKCGIAIQSAVAMGIHLRSESPSITHVSKETRYRLWWALYLLNILLCVVTGRMPRMQQEHCTTPLPVPYKEEDFRDEHVMRLILDIQSRSRLMASLLSFDPSTEPNDPLAHSPSSPFMSHQASPGLQIQANVSLYFLYSIDLAAVMREAIEILYSPEAGRKSRNDTEMAMLSLNRAADNWFARLPGTYSFAEIRDDRPFVRQRTSLAFQYYSTKLVISQPALRCDVFSTGLDTPMAMVCLNAAGQMLDLLPNEPNISWLLGCSPWWCSLHYLTQSTVVLTTQLLIQNQPRASERNEALERVQKALRWLHECSTKDPSYKRAWCNFTELLSSQGSKLSE
ncbi:transcriptional regulator family: Fungal Specific TF [Penicillium roqueforti]|nr:transcriptional regulator family: Fungal Specific TF [Penicillium roqueforti]KAI2727255.1 transcriptional regulator family: Fungal Specific TF [Penicillium roqueforti]